VSLFAELKRRNVFRVAIAYGVIAWVLAQIADLAFDNFGSPEWVSKSFLFLLLLGLPLAIFFAWAFELTPEGIKKEKDVDRDESITPKTGQKLNYVIIGVLIIAVGFLLSDKLQPPEPVGLDEEAYEVVETDTSKLSIAVLPFENRSDRSEDAFFAEGIHDDLLTTIANIGSMKVISRTSVMEYKDTTKKIPEIAKELGVANILEGGVQRSGNQVRINVQLIDAETDEHLWAEIYDRQLTAENLFVIQSEVSTAIANALHATLSPDEQQRINSVPTQNLEAYEAYMLGRQRWVARTADSTAEAVLHFQKATDLDPNFAQAYSGLADAYRHQVPYGGLPRSEVFPKAERAARKALELDNQLGEAHATLGGLLRQMGDLENAEVELRRAIELNPNYSAAYNWLGLVQGSRGEFNTALETFKEGLAVDPLSPVLHGNVIAHYGVIGRFDEMRAGAERLIELSPESTFGYEALFAYHYSVTGRLDTALVWHNKAIELDGNDVEGIIDTATTFLDLGDYQSADYWIDRASDVRAENFSVSVGRFAFAKFTDNADDALTHIRKAEEQAAGLLFDPFVLTELYLDDLKKGNAENALARYVVLYPSSGGVDGFVVNRANFYWAPDIVHLLRAGGREDEAGKLLQDLLLQLESVPVLGPGGYGPVKSIALAMAGKEADAMIALQAVVDAGWRYFWWYYFDHHPAFESLRDKPEFQELREKVAADIANQLKNVRRMEANGELPTNWVQRPAKSAPPPT
jgi:TolB-like protein